MNYSQELQTIAHYAQRLEIGIERLTFCFRVYLEFTEQGREPSTSADGTVIMNAEKSLQQLCEAVRSITDPF